jgi:phosphoesterase RecJ-like protein
MDNTKAFTRLKEIIDRSQRFFLISHVYTDGDALGSIIAMYHYLTLLGKEVVATVPGEIPAKYTFLGHQKIINIRSAEATKQFIQSADVILILDISSLKRMDVWYDPVMQSKASKICIDHHPGGCSGVDFQIIDDRRIATTEILYQYFKTNQIPITRPMGLALYTGILSDSGSFRFEGTSAFTLQMAGELAQLGIDPSEIFRYIFENSTKK